MTLSIAVARALLSFLLLSGPAGTGASPAPPDNGPPRRDERSTLETIRALLAGGHYADAESAARAELRAVEEASGAASPQEAPILDLLVESLWRGGKAAQPESLELAERAVAMREKAGPQHLHLAVSLKNLANVLSLSGELSRAVPLYERAIRILEDTGGPEDPEVATNLSNLGNIRLRQGDLDEARRLHERALAIRETALGPGHVDVASSLNNLGSVLQAGWDLAAAQARFERALAIQEEALSPDHPDVGSTLNNLANVLFRLGRFPEARDVYARAVDIQEQSLGPDHPDLARSLSNLATLTSRVGDLGAARALLERALAIRERALGTDDPAVASTLSNLANVLRQSGELAPARRLYERAIAIRRETVGSEHPSLIADLNNLANLLAQLGETDQALPMHERILGIRERTLGGDHPDVAASLNNLSVLLRTTGDLSRSEQLLERSLRIKEKILGEDHPDLVSGLNNLGILRIRSGRGAEAEPVLLRALAIAERTLGPEHTQVAETLQHLAVLRLETGDLDEALAHSERALAIWRSARGPEHPSLGNELLNHGDILRALGDLRAAVVPYRQAIAVLEASLGGGHPDLATAHIRLGQLHWRLGELRPALEESLRGERILREHLRQTARALSEREALQYEAIRASGLDVAISVLAALPGSEATPEMTERVWDEVTRARALVLDEMAARSRAVARSGDAELRPLLEDLDAARVRLVRIATAGPDPESPTAYRERMERARLDKEQAERRLAVASSPYRKERERQAAGFAEVVAAQPDRSGLLSFVRFQRWEPSGEGAERRVEPSRQAWYAAFSHTPASGTRFLAVGSAEEVERLVQTWRAAAGSDPRRTSPSAREGEERYREAGRPLRRRVWDPLAGRFAGLKRVFVVPEGALHLVSLAALPAEDERYLVEMEPRTHMLSSERDLLRARLAPNSGEVVLLVGDPDYGSRAPVSRGALATVAAEAQEPTGSHPCAEVRDLVFEPLPGTLRETSEVAGILRQGQDVAGETGPLSIVTLTGSDAAEPAVRRQAPGKAVLHLATHGFFADGPCGSQPGAPRSNRSAATESIAANPLLRSGLALAGANRRDAASPGDDDGLLLAEEIAAMELSRTRWVVLSACETGVGTIESGEGVMGMRRAFQIAGAGTLIMSLWAVEDNATAAWMKGLYAARSAGESTLDSVHRASLGLLAAQRRRRGSTHPYYWGAFVATGDWR